MLAGFFLARCHRVQVFDANGKYETQWNNLHRPCGLFMPPGKCPVCYIGELGTGLAVNRNVPNLGPRVTIVDSRGKRISRLGGLGPGSVPRHVTCVKHFPNVCCHVPRRLRCSAVLTISTYYS